MNRLETWTDARIPVPAFPSDSPERSKLPISDDLEPLVDISERFLPWENAYYAEDTPPYFHRAPGAVSRILVRRTVADKLVRVNGALKEWWLEIFLLDGHRPLRVQEHFYYDWIPSYLRRLNPEASREWISNETANYWAKPFSDWSEELYRSPPPHTTWWAVDLVLRRTRDGARLEMGTIFDDITERSHLRHFETVSNDGIWFTEAEARKNRRVLYWAMRSENFAPHPKEWWHFSFGDQAWAYSENLSAARYWFIAAEDSRFFQTEHVG